MANRYTMANSGKILTDATLIIGILIVAIGGHAYFQSPWNKSVKNEAEYELCKEEAMFMDKMCPNLSLEVYFMIVNALTMIFSFSLIVVAYLEVKNERMNLLESYYKLIAGVLVLISGITIIISAVQIDELRLQKIEASGTGGTEPTVPELPSDLEGEADGRNEFQYYDEKIVAGVFALANGIIFLAAATKGFENVGRMPSLIREDPYSI